VALVLSLKHGEHFWVAHAKVTVGEIVDAKLFWLEVEGGQKHRVTDDRATEIMDDVFVSSGDMFNLGLLRVVIDAPRSIEILRDERYRAKYPQHEFPGLQCD